MTESGVREPAVAGIFYPGESGLLQRSINEMLGRASGLALPKAMIVPHAGYPYSGQVAADIYKSLQGQAGKIKRVVMFGPSHRCLVSGLARSSAHHFATPLGSVPIDLTSLERLSGLKQISTVDEAHVMEHSLEVQLPFLQTLLGDFSLIPLVAGKVSPKEVAEVMSALWGGEETILVVSSDLSHYQEYQQAQQHDGQTSEVILALQGEKLQQEDACGAVLIQGLLLQAQARGMRVELVSRCNSGDTAGDMDRVVGYGAYALY